MGYRQYGRGKNARFVQNCERCQRGRKPYPMKPDIAQEAPDAATGEPSA